MADPDPHMNTNAGISITTTLLITIAIVTLNFVLFVVIFVLFIRARGNFRTRRSSGSRHLIFAPQEPTLPRRALDPSIFNSLPITVFRSEDFKEGDGLECAVCLCELIDGEETRLLPKCNHGFHVECIDMWFRSNSTCPLCRISVSTESTVEIQIQIQPLEPISEPGHSSNSPSSSLNAESSRFAGPSSSSVLGKGREGMLVIDIPRRMLNGFSSSNSPLPLSRPSPNSPLPTSRLLAEGTRSPALGRMRSLRRILSRGSGKEAGPSCNPRGCHVEQEGLADSKCQ